MPEIKNGEILSLGEVEKIVEKTLGGENFQVVRYELKRASESTMGFLGEHLKLEIQVKHGWETTTFSYFVKTMPISIPQHMKYATGTRAFYKEIELYKTLFADMRKLQKNSPKWCPDYHYSRGEEIIVIDDLSPKGYYMLPERTLMDEEHVRASLKAIAVMHAGSFILEDRIRLGLADSLSPNYRKSDVGKNTTLGEIYHHLTYETEVSDVKGHIGNDFMEVGFKSQVPLVDLLEGYTESEKQKIRERLPHVLRRIMPLVKPSEKYKNVFIHGDLWSNNLLFRKDASGKVADAIIIDFQLARYAPPAHDLMMFFYLVQNRHFREKKQAELLNYYYNVLSEELSRSEISIESVLPKNVFLETCQFYRELGIVSAILYFQLILVPSDIVSKFMSSPESYENVMLVDRSEVIKECFQKDGAYRERVVEAMDELIREYILK